MVDGPGAPAFAGVDTHKDTNMLGLKDGLGRTIGTWEFPADPRGYEALADAIDGVARDEKVIEAETTVVDATNVDEFL